MNQYELLTAQVKLVTTENTGYPHLFSAQTMVSVGSDELAELRRIFVFSDSDGDGMITTAEFEDVSWNVITRALCVHSP